MDAQALFPDSLLGSADTLDGFIALLGGRMEEAMRGARLEASQPRGPSLEEQIAEVIRANYADPNLSAAEISSMLKLSSATLSRAFNSRHRQSIPAYINGVRMEKAAEWLRNSKLGVREIAARVGFRNESYFFKVFKKQYGKSPQEYREGR